MKELVFETVPCLVDGGRIDGPCKLPSQIEWPLGPDSLPLFHLVSIPLLWIAPNQVGQSSQARWVSVFISYDKEGYSHYGKMTSDDTGHAEAAVILHDMTGPDRSMHPHQALSSKNIKVVPAKDGDDNIASYIGSTPTWVQDPISLDEYKWVLSIYGPDMDESLGENAGILSDGVGYVFLKTSFNVDSFGSVGKFFFQL